MASTGRRLPDWTQDQFMVDAVLRRRGLPGTATWQTWNAVLLVATDLADAARYLGAASLVVPRLHHAVQKLVAELPAADAAPLLPLDVLTAEGVPVPESRAVLASALADAADALAALVAAPLGRDGAALLREAAHVLAGVAPLLSAWAARVSRAQPMTLLPAPSSEPDGRY